MVTIVGRARVLGIVFALLLCLAVPLSLAQDAKAEPTEYAGDIADLPASRVYSSVAEDNGKLYIVGGWESDMTGMELSLRSVLIYDIATGTVTQGADIPTGVSLFSITKGIDGRLYVFGGYNSTMGWTTLTQIYNITSDSWSNGAPCPVSLGGGSAVPVANGSIYVIGANSADNGNSTLVYDPVADSWRYSTDQPVTVWLRMASYWSASSIIVTGGVYAGGAVDSTYSFNPMTEEWTLMAPMPNPAAFGGVATAPNGVVYCFGGVDASSPLSGVPISAIQKYDPVADAWSVSTFSSLSPARSAFGYSIDSLGRIFTVGGYDGGSALPTVTMIVPTDLVYDELQIVGPTDGAIVSGTVTISVAFKTPDVGMPVIDIFVDGVFLDSQTAPSSGGTVSYVWDASALTPGSPHVITARGTLWNGVLREDSVTVVVVSDSVEAQVAVLRAQADAILVTLGMIAQGMVDQNASTMAYLDAQIGALQAALVMLGQAMVDANASTMAYLDAQLAQLQVVLAQIGNGLVAMGAGQSAAMDGLNVTLDDLQTQLDDFQEQIDRIEGKADTAGTYSIVNLVLVIIVVVLLALMLMMVRKKP
jgi:N-acetylneuraminic acid mutarotase